LPLSSKRAYGTPAKGSSPSSDWVPNGLPLAAASASALSTLAKKSDRTSDTIVLKLLSASLRTRNKSSGGK
jgi:hypothetical protein